MSASGFRGALELCSKNGGDALEVCEFWRQAAKEDSSQLGRVLLWETRLLLAHPVLSKSLSKGTTQPPKLHTGLSLRHRSHRYKECHFSVALNWEGFTVWGFPNFGLPYWGPYYKGILLFGDLCWRSPVFGVCLQTLQGPSGCFPMGFSRNWGYVECSGRPRSTIGPKSKPLNPEP